METQPEETRTCSNSKHPMSGNSTVSPYPKDKVPKPPMIQTVKYLKLVSIVENVKLKTT